MVCKIRWRVRKQTYDIQLSEGWQEVGRVRYLCRRNLRAAVDWVQAYMRAVKRPSTTGEVRYERIRE